VQAYRSVLRPDPLVLGRSVPASIGLHVALVALAVGFQSLEPDHGPMIDPDDVMTVTIADMPPAKSAVTQKAMKAPTPPQGADTPTPPPPPTASDMVQHTPDAPPAPKGMDAATREELLRQMKKQALLDSLSDAPEGAFDNAAANPDGVEGGGGSSTGAFDPELSAYAAALKRALLANFNPIQSDAALRTVFIIRIDSAGTITDYEMTGKSGNPSFDAAALRAIVKTRKVPVPPDSHKDAILKSGMELEFTPQAGL